MNNALTIAQVVSAVLLMATILMQSSGAGLGGAFGGNAEVYSTKRGAEKIVFNASIVFAILFMGLGIARLVLA